jgi:hypothetical protein
VFLGDESHTSDSLIKVSRIATNALLNGTPQEEVLVLKLREGGENICGQDTYDEVPMSDVFSASRHPAGTKN